MEARDFEIEFGAAIRRARIRGGMSIDETAAKANLTPKTVRTLELGRGSSLHTTIKVLEAIGAAETLAGFIDAQQAFSPIAEYRAYEKRNAQPQRASRKRKRESGQADGV